VKTASRVKHFALRLQPSLMEEAKKVAKAEGVAVNQLINAAVAEKVSALRTEEHFPRRAAKGFIKKALQVLKRAGKGNPPVPRRRTGPQRECVVAVSPPTPHSSSIERTD
jgi:HicB family